MNEYAAQRHLTLADVARHTGRALETVKDHSARMEWAKHREQVQQARGERLKQRLIAKLERFDRHRLNQLMRLSHKAMRRFERQIDGGEENGDVDAFGVAALLNQVDKSRLASKVAEALPTLLFESIQENALTQLVAEQLKLTRAHLSGASASSSTSTPSSTQKPSCANARAASLFSPPNRSS